MKTKEEIEQFIAYLNKHNAESWKVINTPTPHRVTVSNQQQSGIAK